MRTDRWAGGEPLDHGTTWTDTAITVLGAVLRWLIILLAQHCGG